MIHQQIIATVEESVIRIGQMEEEKMNFVPAPGKWSAKEILGHLVDSAQTNLRRFIVSQYEDAPYIVYAQNEWVRLSGYAEMQTKEIIQLWVLLNRRIAYLISQMNEETLKRHCVTGTPQEPQPHTLQWLAEDYLRHMQHHLDQIIQRTI